MIATAVWSSFHFYGDRIDAAKRNVAPGQGEDSE
jgi:hypothetical protein